MEHLEELVWEASHACELECRTCRGSERVNAAPPHELDTERALQLFGEASRLGLRRIELLGGDLSRREDLHALIARASELGLALTLATCPSSHTTRGWLTSLRAHGPFRISVGLDGPTPRAHDAQRGAIGCHRRACALLTDANAEGLETDVHSMVLDVADAWIERLGAEVAALGATRWRIVLAPELRRALRRDAEHALALCERAATVARLVGFEVRIEGICLPKGVVPSPVLTIEHRLARPFVSTWGDVRSARFSARTRGNVLHDTLLACLHPAARSGRARR